MFYNRFYFDPTMVLLIPAMLFALYAQMKMQSTYSRYSQVASSRGLTGAQVARFILDQSGLHNVPVEPISGQLTDHYDPRTKVVRLSQGVFQSNSIAAIGVAAHECGHAIQDAQAYAPLKFRNAIVPITNIGSNVSFVLFFIGFILGLPWLLRLGIIAFSLLVIFQAVTLPVEFNASRRALNIIEQGQLLVGSEYEGAKKVLQAAAMTYVAALLSVLSTLLRYVFLARSRDRDN